jgi:hypothetical protein
MGARRERECSRARVTACTSARPNCGGRTSVATEMTQRGSPRSCGVFGPTETKCRRDRGSPEREGGSPLPTRHQRRQNHPPPESGDPEGSIRKGIRTVRPLIVNADPFRFGATEIVRDRDSGGVARAPCLTVEQQHHDQQGGEGGGADHGRECRRRRPEAGPGRTRRPALPATSRSTRSTAFAPKIKPTTTPALISTATGVVWLVIARPRKTSEPIDPRVSRTGTGDSRRRRAARVGG